MLKRRLCEARFEWKLTCDGPLLIKDGRYDKRGMPQLTDGKYPDGIFISRTPYGKVIEQVKRGENKLAWDYYVPGTSLRGPFRAQSERIIRSLLPEEAQPPATACDPLDMDKDDGKACSKRLDSIDKTQPGLAYKSACPACKLFGCTGTASRIQFSDADIANYHSVFRDMIGIDRFTGGVRAGPMKFHALENTSFQTSVTVVNFELWQLGLLAYVFRDFQEGLVPIGFGKTKGFGLVKGEVRSIVFRYPKGKCDGTAIQHLCSLVSPEESLTYGLESEPTTSFTLKREEPDPLSFYESFSVETDLPGFWSAVAPAFNRYLERLEEEAAA